MENPDHHGQDAGGASAGTRLRLLDPSEAVTGLAFVFGIIGALIAVIATLALTSGSSAGSLIVQGVIAVFAGGSGGIVIGGMIGAIIGVVKGVIIPVRSDRVMKKQEGPLPPVSSHR